jgi:hypothetical protein
LRERGGIDILLAEDESRNWWDSSTPGWVYNLVPTYAQEIYKFRIELEGEIDI